MKSNSYSSSRIPALLAATVVIAGSAHAADFTWEGGTGNWNAANWNDGTNGGLTGPISAGNTAAINSGNVTLNVGGPGNLDSITLGSGSQLNMYNGDGGIFAYQGLSNLILQGGTVNGGSATYNAYGCSFLGNVTVSGTAASTITGGSWFNVGDNTYTVADVTGDSATDLLVSTSLRGPVGSPDTNYTSASITKEGAGTMEITAHSYFWGGLALNGGALKLSGGNGGYGFFAGTVAVNAGTTLETVSDGTGLGWQSGWKPGSVSINGGTITTAGTSHIWAIGGGINMTGGTLQSNGGVSSPTGGQLEWWQTDVNTLASSDTATIGGRIRIRADGGYGGPTFNVAEGAAATDLLVSAAINEANGTVGVTKSGAGTMELSGANSYAGATVVSGGTLVLSGAGNYGGAIQVGTGSALTLSNAVIGDGAPVTIASGAVVNLNFAGNDVVGSLDIDGSGSLPADTYNSSHATYGSYFSGSGSLVVLGASSSWISLADGNWSDSANWAGGIIATGGDSTATFNAATGATVTLDSNRIIGNLAFDVSDYVIAGGNTLSLNATTTPTVSVASGRSATISAGLAGTLGLEKTGAGALVLSGVKSYTGGTTVTAGTLELNSSTFDYSAINGSLTVQSAGTLKLSGFDYTGLGKDGARVTYLEVNGGNVDNTIQSWVSGATVNLTGGTLGGAGTFHIISSALNSSESGTTSTISGNLLIRKDYGSTDLSLDVADGTAATDLLITGSIGNVLAAGLGKSGPGKLVLSGTNTYTGNTVVTDGALEVTSGLRFRPTTNGATNSVSNSGTSTVTFSGTVELDLTAAAVANGNVWDLFNLLSYSGLAPSAVTSTTLGSFTEATPGTWELPVASAKWVFTEADGNLTYVVTATDYDNWADSFSLVGGPAADDDNDGLTNEKEYAFGLVPNSGSSVNPIAVPFDKTGGTFSYTRRSLALQDPDLDYSVWYSTNLGSWTEDTGATEGTPSLSGDVETVPVTISPALLSNTKLFIQVRAE